MAKFWKILIVMALLTVVFSAKAITTDSPADLVINISPSSPKAGTDFSAEAKSFSFDLSRARVQWFVNNKSVASGTGLVNESFTAGNLGSSMAIRVKAIAQTGQAHEASVFIPVGDIDFIISPLTYTPAFYRGAALPTPASLVNVFAVPHLFSKGARLATKNLFYEWSVNGKPILAQSGVGSNKLSVQLADIRSGNYVIGLRVSTADRSLSIDGNTTIQTTSPNVLFYETSPLTGINPNSSAVFAAKAGETFSITAEPYFLSLESLAKAKFTWNANGTNLKASAANPRLLDLTTPPQTESQSVFTFTADDRQNIFQKVSGILTVTASP